MNKNVKRFFFSQPGENLFDYSEVDEVIEIGLRGLAYSFVGASSSFDVFNSNL